VIGKVERLCLLEALELDEDEQVVQGRRIDHVHIHVHLPAAVCCRI
jgi:hypothetical protein